MQVQTSFLDDLDPPNPVKEEVHKSGKCGARAKRVACKRKPPEAEEESAFESSLGSCASDSSGTEDRPAKEAKNEARLDRRALADVDSILMDLVPQERVAQCWDRGLSPEELYSFQHAISKVRHWALSEDPVKFICARERGMNHHRGGNASMDILKGICDGCLKEARTAKTANFKQFMVSQVKVTKPVG
jgi:hypothetical protein